MIEDRLKAYLFLSIFFALYFISYIIVFVDVRKEKYLMKYVCDICGWIYDETLGDPDNGIAEGTKFEDLPEDFVCPLCHVGKDQFSKVEE